MDSDKNSSKSIYQAPPVEQRKSLVIKKDEKICHPNQVPNEIANDQFLTTLIHESLPKNYNFEIRKTIWKIKQTGAKRVILQLPEGLIRFGTVLVDVMSAYLKENGCQYVNFIIMGDLTYGACCIDDYLADSMNCDLIIHYAHSCLVPINQMSTNVKYLYVFLDIKFDLDHITKCIKHNFNPHDNNIALASTIQFLSSVHLLAKELRSNGFQVTLPQSRPLSSGEVLGCTAPKLDSQINTIVFICDGRFHLEALMIANPGIPAYRYDPYSRKLTLEQYSYDEMYKLRKDAIEKAVDTMRNGGNFGFVLGTLGRQGSEIVYDRLIEQLQTNTKCKHIKLLIPEVVQDTLDYVDSVDVWVQVACPRLSIDWGGFFKKPLLNTYEFAQSIKNFKDQPTDLAARKYPMDFYAKHSCGSHTPNHVCQNNPNCLDSE